MMPWRWCGGFTGWGAAPWWRLRPGAGGSVRACAGAPLGGGRAGSCVARPLGGGMVLWSGAALLACWKSVLVTH